MRFATGVALLMMSCAPWSSAAGAASFEGNWIGGFRGRTDWVFVQMRFGGEGAHMAGRADVPETGERAILLEHVQALGRRLSFDLPGPSGSLLFRGELVDDARVVGTVQKGSDSSEFELRRSAILPREALAGLAGDFEGVSSDDRDDVVLVYPSGAVAMYVDYRTGRLGRLFPIDESTFVSGPNALAGFPVELTVAVERDEAGAATGLTWSRRGEPVRRLSRRQRYRVEDVSFESADGARLSGALLLPLRPGPHPALVLIPGSGATTAEDQMPLADPFARNGIAVLVHDKRGVGRSTGNYARAGFDQLSDDAVAGVALLRAHRAIDAGRVGLLGTSLGGWVAPLAASRCADVRFVVVESAPAVTPAEHERQRVVSQMRADGASRDAIAHAVAFMDAKFAVGRTGEGWEELVARMEQGRREGWLAYTNPAMSLESLQWNWTHVLSYDPRPALEALRVPVLALYGELDRVVDPHLNGDRLARVLRDAGNTDVTIRVLPGANHGFLAAATGGPREAARLKEIVPNYFSTRVGWVLDRVGTSAPATHLTNNLPSGTTPAAAGTQEKAPVAKALAPGA